MKVSLSVSIYFRYIFVSHIGMRDSEAACFRVILLISLSYPYSIESLERQVHSYSVQMGPSSLHRRNWTVSARGDFVNVRPDSTLGGGPGI